MDPRPAESSEATEGRTERRTLNDVIFFDLEELQEQSALIPSTAPLAMPALSLRPARSSRPSDRRSLSRLALKLGEGRAPQTVSLRPSASRALAQRDLPTVSILTCATSDAVGLARKLENTLAMCRRSEHRTEVIVGCDGEDEAVMTVLRAYELQGVRVISWAQRVGALTTWAKVTHASRHDIVVFTDVNARMAPQALDRLLAPMLDTNVGMTVPSYVPCVDDGREVRARLEAATRGVTAASYACVAVRRRLLRRAAHDTVQPALAAALHVLGRGQRVVALPTVRVFHPELASSSARFRHISEGTRGKVQAALRQRRHLRVQHQGIVYAMLHEALNHVPVLATWIGAMAIMIALGALWSALALCTAGLLGIARASKKSARSTHWSWLDRWGATLSAGAAQTYGLMRARG